MKAKISDYVAATVCVVGVCAIPFGAFLLIMFALFGGLGCANAPTPVVSPSPPAVICPMLPATPALPKVIAESPLMGPDGSCTPPPVEAFGLTLYACEGRKDTLSAQCVLLMRAGNVTCGMVVARLGCAEPWLFAGGGCEQDAQDPGPTADNSTRL